MPYTFSHRAPLSSFNAALPKGPFPMSVCVCDCQSVCDVDTKIGTEPIRMRHHQRKRSLRKVQKK